MKKHQIFLLIIFSLFILPNILATSITVKSAQDANVLSDVPDKNYEGYTYHHTTSLSWRTAYTYLQFNLTNYIPESQIIFLSGNLTVRHCSFSGNSGWLYFYEVLNHSWNEDTMTWNNGQPLTNSSTFKQISYSYTVPSNSTYDLKDFISSEFNEDKIVDMRIGTSFGNTWTISSEDGCLKPELNIQYRNITCGDSICDSGYEDQNNCCQDCGCPSEKQCMDGECWGYFGGTLRDLGMGTGNLLLGIGSPALTLFIILLALATAVGYILVGISKKVGDKI